MSKADYPYPDDEFDAEFGADVPRGVHREPRSGWSRWWPFLLVIVLAPAVAFGVVTLLTHEGGGSSGDQAVVDDDGGDSGDVTGPSDTATDDTAPGQTATSQSPPPAGTPTDIPSEPADSPTPQVQLDTPVVILNAARIQGLAARAAGKVTAVGFTAVTTGNLSTNLPPTSTVFYASADLEATASQVAQTLGLTTVTLDAASAGTGVTVVLTSDLPA